VSEVTVVLSDLHANGRALASAVDDALRRGFDRLIVLGDLLTYGLDLDEVIERVAHLRDTRGATVIVGNHDQLYFDLAAGNQGYYDTLPEWLRETVAYTLSRLDVRAFAERFDWRPSTTEGPWLFAHANPFAFGDWRYLYNPSDALEAALSLRDRSMVGGVFGHTHRRFAMAFSHHQLERNNHPSATIEASSYDVDVARPIDEASPNVFVVNPGSVGQPRHRDRASTYLRMTRSNAQVTLEHIAVAYDSQAHVQALRDCQAMSESTREKLCSFFEPAR
jgi:predicted phosphodiesterase